MTVCSLFALGCTTNTNAPTKVAVDTILNVAVSRTEENGDSIIPMFPYLIEQTIHVSELVYYPENDGLITVPFNFSDTTKYAAMTEANLDKRIAIIVNGEIMSTPVVKATLTNGACFILLTKKQAEQLFPNADINQLFNN